MEEDDPRARQIAGVSLRLNSKRLPFGRRCDGRVRKVVVSELEAGTNVIKHASIICLPAGLENYIKVLYNFCIDNYYI